MRLFALALLLVGCSNGTTVDGGTDAPAEGSSSEAGTCGISLCTPYGTTSAECPKCAPANNGACTPAGITCDYSNGCSSGALNTAFCTCIVPDAGADAAVDGGTWSCKYGA